MFRCARVLRVDCPLGFRRCWTSRQWHPSDTSAATLDGLIFAQAALVAMWAAFGRTPLPWRAAATVSAVTLATMVTTSTDPARPREHVAEVAVLLLAQAAVIAGSLAIVRNSLGGPSRFELKEWVARLPADNGEARRRQFSLRAVFAWMTGIIIFLSAIRCVIPPETAVPHLSRLTRAEILPLTGTLGLAAAALWTMLGVHWRMARVTATAIALAAAFATAHAGLGRIEPALVFCSVQSFCLFGSLGVYRVAGYRFIPRSQPLPGNECMIVTRSVSEYGPR